MNTLPARLWASRVGTVAGLHTSTQRQEIYKQTRLRVVDNSALGKAAMLEGRPPKCIHIYNKKGIGHTGKYVIDLLLVS